MSIATLAQVLTPATNYTVAGLVVLGWEDARAWVAAAEAEQAPLILLVGPGCRSFTPVSVMGAMLRHLAEQATVPVVVQLDHGRDLDECRAAIDAGFSSIMYDGSSLPLAQNIHNTQQARKLADAAGISLEGEVGVVGYANDGQPSNGTDPAEAAQFARETDVDALAVAIGNVHLMTQANTTLDWPRLRAIEQACSQPLVLHGVSGIDRASRQLLAQDSRVGKFNIGTQLRQAFGQALRETLQADPDSFDRLQIMRGLTPALVEAARQVLRSTCSDGKAHLGSD